MRVRRMRLADLPCVMRIERACFRSEGYGLGTFLAHLLRDHRGAFVAENEQGEVVGYVLVRLSHSWRRPRRGGITSIGVVPIHRRQGFGRKLLEAALEHLREHRANEADLEVRVTNAAALSLYRSVGFRCSERLPDYYGHNGDGMRMVLDLRSPVLARQKGDAGT